MMNMSNVKTGFENSVEHDLLSSELGMQLLERYLLVKKLHESTVSQIFVLRDSVTKEHFVLKAIRNGEFSCDTDAFDKLDHPNIVRIIGTYTTEKYTYILKEYIKGITLQEYVARTGPLPEGAVLEIGLMLCEILFYLHSMKPMPIIFRDLKPANLIMTDSGEIKLIDLDSVRRFKASSPKDTFYIGTEGFASPEQFGFGQTDVRTDIYTLGTTLYYLLTGETPVSDKFKLKSVGSVRKDISSELSRIIEKCTMFDPEDRYPDISALRADLAAIMEQNRLKKVLAMLVRLWKTPYGRAAAVFVCIAAVAATVFLSSSGKPVVNTGGQRPAGTAAGQEESSKEQVIRYADRVGATQPVFDLDKLGVSGSAITGIRLEKAGELVPLQFDVKGHELRFINNHLPESFLDIHAEYVLKIFAGSRQSSIHFVPVPEALEDTGSLSVFYIPACPDKGFRYPYYLVLPSDENREKNRGRKNYLLVEPYNMGKVSDDIRKHIELALENTLAKSAAIADEMGIPRLVPVFVRPQSRLQDKEIYSHDLTRDTLLLDRYKQAGGGYPEVFEPMDRIDLQLVQMIRHANAYLNEKGWAMEEKVFLWGTGAAGSFVNRFTLLHPNMVKAVCYRGFPTLPLAEAGGEALPYPAGTSDFKEITGEDFDLEAYNKVAKFGYIGIHFDNNQTLRKDILLPDGKVQLQRVMDVREYPDRWDILRGLYENTGLQAQITLYEDFAMAYDDTMRFLEANRESRLPAYIDPAGLKAAKTFIYRGDRVEVRGELPQEESQPFGYEKTTVTEAFWSGTLPQSLPLAFINFYMGEEASAYSPDVFFISIREWNPEMNHEQMSERIKRVGGGLTLRAENCSDVEVEMDGGSMTSGGGDAQIYFVRVKNPDVMLPGVKYKIVDTTGYWKINPNVFIQKPAK